METEYLYKEKQHLGHNRMSMLRRTVLAIFAFVAYYFSPEESVTADAYFVFGIILVLSSIALMYVLHFKTLVTETSITLDGLWTSRVVKIDLRGISSVKKIKYSKSVWSRSVYNLHRKGVVKFHTSGQDAVELTDKEGMKYIIGSQRVNELKYIIKSQLKELKQ